MSTSSHVDTPIVFSVCQESREAAFLAGYRVWTMYSCISRLQVRDVMWNPKLDTMLLLRSHFLDECGPLLLRNLFPHDAPLVERLAVDCPVAYCYTTEHYMLPHFRMLTGLKEVIFVLDSDDASALALDEGIEMFNEAHTSARVEQCLVDFRKMKLEEGGILLQMWRNWNPPKVRVAWGADSIMEKS